MGDALSPIIPPMSVTRVLPRPWAFVVLVVAMAIAAANPVVGRAVIAEVPPMALTFWRFVAAGVALLPVGLAPLWADREVYRRHWRLVLVLGALGIGVYNAFLYLGIQTTTAVNASLIVGAAPVAVVLITLVFLRESVGLRTLVGVALGFVGLMVIVVRGDLAVLWHLAFVPGDLLMVIATLGFASYAVLLRKLPRGLHPIGFMLVIDLVALAAVTPFYLWELADGRTFVATNGVVVAILYVGVMATAVSFSLYNWGVASVGPNLATQFVYLAPVFTALMAVVFLDEYLHAYHAAGVALIFAGIYLATTRRKTTSVERAPTENGSGR
ncbi:MAG: DMT family transporter [Alphaproteobacteria bacterium]|nr:DMT family transporter [Alphaproteobacteria bacterium]